MTTFPATISERITLTPRSQPARAEGGGPLTPSDILGMLRRRLVLIVVLFVLFSGLALGGFAAWWFYFPGFQGESLIACISNIPETEMTFEQQRLKQDEHERFVLSQSLLLKSPTILGKTLQVTAVRETDWYKWVISRKWEPLIELTDQLTAAPVRGTNFLRVAIECRNPKDPAVIVNEVVRQWYETVKARSADEFTDDSLEAARAEQSAVEKSISEKRDRLKEMALRLPAGAVLDPANNITAQGVRQFGEQVAQLQLELAQLEQYRAIYNDPAGVAVTAEDRAIVEQDPQVAELARVHFLLTQQRSADAKVYGAGHAVLRQLDAQIEAADARLAELRFQKYEERKADIRDATNTAYDNTRHALFLAQENLAKAEAQLQDQDRLLFDYRELESQINQDVRYRLELVDYVKGLTRVKTQRTAIRVNVEQPAIDPLERSSPSLFFVPVGVFLALVVAMGLALTLELMDKSVRTSQDISRFLDTAVLGAIPHTDDDEVPIERVETAVRDAPKSAVAEAFRGIRTSLHLTAPLSGQRTVLVTSAKPDDGKTTVACNLAMTIAQSGKRVLLVDANFRRPALQNLFPKVGLKGFSNLLVGDGDLSTLAASTEFPSLQVLGSGPLPPNPVELLDSPACRSLLRDAADRYDQVIVDAPPVLLASDAIALSTLADGVILVVRAKQNTKGVARRALRVLHEANARVLGAVLNAAQAARGGYMREQLRTYYEYQPEEKR